MHRRARLLPCFIVTAALVPVALLGASSCSGGGDAPIVAPAPDTGVADTPSPMPDVPPADDTGPSVHCKLDNGTDPVGLCVQKLILRAEHEAAFVPALGVARSWDSKTFAPDKDPTGATAHDVHDDAAYAAAISRYLQSARRYGDNEINKVLGPDLIAISANLEAALATPPAEYGGDLYLDLRVVAAGLRYEGFTRDAQKLDAIADAYGRAIFDSFYHSLPDVAPSPPDAGPDAGDAAADALTDSFVGDAGDAGETSPDDSDAAAPFANGILGVARGSAYAYVPSDVATGALALLDMALRHSDEAAASARWQRAAMSSLEHLWLRARDPATGMYYQALVTSSEGATDPPVAAAVSLGLPVDALLTDVQATIALALSRMQELSDHDAALLPLLSGYPFEAHSDAAIAACNGKPSLWDATKNGYLDGFVPSTGELLATKSTRTNARMLAAIHRDNSMRGSPFAVQLKPLRGVMLDRSPVATSLMSVLPDQSGYLRRAPRSFAASELDAGADPTAKSYVSAANTAAIEGLTEQWFGLPF